MKERLLLMSGKGTHFFFFRLYFVLVMTLIIAILQLVRYLYLGLTPYH